MAAQAEPPADNRDIPAPATTTVFVTRPGQFEIVAAQPGAAAALTSLANEGWRTLAAPLGLPAAFSSPIFVRLIPATEWHEAAPFLVSVEPGGVVSVRLSWEPSLEADIARRALVQALLLRLAVAHHGVTPRLAVPLWLEQGAVGWWVTRAQPARLDAWQQEAAEAPDVPLARLLAWQRGEPEPRAWRLASLWLFSFLQDEAGKPQVWRDCLRRVLGGEPISSVLAACYPAGTRDENMRELWWRVGLHHERRLKALPWLTAVESRAWLAELPRVVLRRADVDTAVPLEALFAARTQPAVAAEVTRRVGRLERELTWVHPLYRNAALSLGAAFEAIRAGDAAKFAAAREQFAQDAREGWQIEQAMEAALDQLEASP